MEKGAVTADSNLKEPLSSDSLPPARRLSGHDEWGGVEYNVQLSHFANVYTKGRAPSIFEILASIGGASASLIGFIGLLVVVRELVAHFREKYTTKQSGGGSSGTDYQQQEGTSGTDGETSLGQPV